MGCNLNFDAHSHLQRRAKPGRGQGECQADTHIFDNFALSIVVEGKVTTQRAWLCPVDTHHTFSRLTTLSATQAALVTTTLALLWLSSRWAFVRCTPVDGKKKFEAATHTQPVCVCLCICVRVRVCVLIYEK